MAAIVRIFHSVKKSIYPSRRFAITRTAALWSATWGTGELTSRFVEFQQLSLQSSRQRYEQIRPKEFMYVDLGIYRRFRARLSVDAQGIVTRYGNVFESI